MKKYVLFFFLFISTVAFGQTESKLDALFYRFQNSVTSTFIGSLADVKDTSAVFLFSIKIMLNKKGNLKLLQLSDNAPAIFKNDLAMKGSKINYWYFKELIAQTKGSNKTVFIIPVMYSKKPNITLFKMDEILSGDLLSLFSYDQKLEDLDKIKLITPLVSAIITYH